MISPNALDWANDNQLPEHTRRRGIVCVRVRACACACVRVRMCVVCAFELFFFFLIREKASFPRSSLLLEISATGLPLRKHC